MTRLRYHRVFLQLTVLLISLMVPSISAAQGQGRNETLATEGDSAGGDGAFNGFVTILLGP